MDDNGVMEGTPASPPTNFDAWQALQKNKSRSHDEQELGGFGIQALREHPGYKACPKHSDNPLLYLTIIRRLGNPKIRDGGEPDNKLINCVFKFLFIRWRTQLVCLKH